MDEGTEAIFAVIEVEAKTPILWLKGWMFFLAACTRNRWRGRVKRVVLSQNHASIDLRSKSDLKSNSRVLEALSVAPLSRQPKTPRLRHTWRINHVEFQGLLCLAQEQSNLSCVMDNTFT